MKNSTKILGSLSLAVILALGVSACGDSTSSGDPVEKVDTGVPTITPVLASSKLVSDADINATLVTYADIALANYTDALIDANALATALSTFTATPTDANFEAAKTAWKTARLSYGTTEAFRLSNGPIDAEAGFGATFGAPEGELNAWPLDENMIDYTKNASGTTTSGNIIDIAGLFTPSGTGASVVNATTITKEVLAALNENGGDANVATGYHAIEFLLWGQDQDYASFIDDTVTPGATVAGERPLTDYTSAANANRRKDYLNAAAELIVDDLALMVNAWAENNNSNYRAAFLGTGSNAITTTDALRQVFAGLGTFIKSELANERVAVALLTPSEEDEHSCFSDNTHVDIDKNYRGFVNILKGEYKGASKGTSFYSLLTQENKTAINTLVSSIDTRVSAMNAAVVTEHFDYQIKDGSSNKQNLKYLKNTLRKLGDMMVYVASEFGISLNESDVTDPDETQI